jgi:hypothetical protein
MGSSSETRLGSARSLRSVRARQRAPFVGDSGSYRHEFFAGDPTSIDGRRQRDCGITMPPASCKHCEARTHRLATKFRLLATQLGGNGDLSIQDHYRLPSLRSDSVHSTDGSKDRMQCAEWDNQPRHANLGSRQITPSTGPKIRPNIIHATDPMGLTWTARLNSSRLLSRNVCLAKRRP